MFFQETFGIGEPDELQQFVAASQQLLHALPSAERHNVEPRIRALQEQYQDIQDKASQKALGLEFQMAADELKRNLKAGEIEVLAEEKELQSGMAPESLINRHEVRGKFHSKCSICFCYDTSHQNFSN